MTKEELLQKINAGEYTYPQRRDKFSFTVRIGNETISISRYMDGKPIAFYCIQAEISDETFNEMKKQALQSELQKVYAQAEELQSQLDDMSE